jgi:hypothetical protein
LRRGRRRRAQQYATAGNAGRDQLAHQFEPALRRRGHFRHVVLHQVGMMNDWAEAATGRMCHPRYAL